jgi:hypothetical protein
MLKRKMLMILSIIVSLSIFVACDENDSPSAPAEEANLRVIHTSYDAPAVDIRVNNTVAISGLAYSQSSGYAVLPSGRDLIVQVTPAGATMPVVINETVRLNIGTENTVFAVNSLNSIEAIVAVDDRTVNSTKARVRFVHGSPDAPAVDIKVNDGNGTLLFGNAAFKSVSGYIEVDPGNYKLAITPAGGTTVVETIDNVPLQAGMIYTVVAQGTFDASDAFPFGVVAYVDNGDGKTSVNLDFVMKSNVRVIHTSYDAPAVDVSVAGTVAISNLGYLASSGYAEVAAGTTNVQVTPTGATSPVVINADLPLDADKSFTVFAVNQLSAIEAVFVEDMRQINAAKAKIRFLHASPDAPAVDIKVGDGNGTALFAGSAFKSVSNYIEVDGGTYDLAITGAGSTDELLFVTGVPLTNGLVYTIVAHGTLDNMDAVDFGVRVYIDNGQGSGEQFVDLPFALTNVLAVHASPDAPAVDLLVDNIVRGTGLAYPNNTGYLNPLAGTRNIKINVSGTATSVIDANLRVLPGASYSVFAVDAVANISPLVLNDDLTAPAAGNAHVRFVHLSPDAQAVDITLTDGTVVFGNRSFKEFTPFTPLGAGTYNLEVRLAGTTTTVLPLPGIVLEDGKIYTVFARGFVNGSAGQELGAQIIVHN